MTAHSKHDVVEYAVCQRSTGIQFSTWPSAVESYSSSQETTVCSREFNRCQRLQTSPPKEEATW